MSLDVDAERLAQLAATVLDVGISLGSVRPVRRRGPDNG